MVSVTRFAYEVIFCDPDICFGCVLVFRCDGGLVDY